MDYEKKYKETLEKAKAFLKRWECVEEANSYLVLEEVKDIFTELKESEDEKIRKSLIDMLKNDEKCYLKEIAWLEKQGTPQVRTGLEWVNTIDDACDKRYSEDYADGEYCHEQSFKWGFQEGVEWLEKQGEIESEDKMISDKNEVRDIEQNSDDKDEKVRKAISQCIEDMRGQFEKLYSVHHKDAIAWLEKQSEKETTLPKWKYKKDHTPLLKDSIILNKYGCVAKSPSGAIISDAWVLDYDELAKLPKEELEKQGEKKPVEEYNGEDFGIDSLYHAQRILEKTLGEVEGYQSDDGILEHKCAISAIKKLYRQEYNWSVEDYSKVQRICQYLNEAKKYYGDITEIKECIEWLKSLKQRIGG